MWVNIFMRFYQIHEGRDATLYHNMFPKKAEQLFDLDEIPATVAHVVNDQIVKGISFTRNVRLATHKRPVFGPIMLTVDQRTLGYNYKIVAIDGEISIRRLDYKNPDLDSDINISSLSSKSEFADRRLPRRENSFAEEFVIGNIKNAHRYITKIILFDMKSQSIYPWDIKTIKLKAKEYIAKFPNIKFVDLTDKRYKRYSFDNNDYLNIPKD